MKKLILPMLLVPMAFFSSCDNKDDLAQVDMTVTLNGVSKSNDMFYTIIGEEITAESISVKSLSGKAAELVNASYFWDGRPIMLTPEEDTWLLTIPTEGMEAGRHVFSVSGTVLEVDKTITMILADYSVNLVESVEELPADAQNLGTESITLTFKASN